MIEDAKSRYCDNEVIMYLEIYDVLNSKVKALQKTAIGKLKKKSQR